MGVGALITRGQGRVAAVVLTAIGILALGASWLGPWAPTARADVMLTPVTQSVLSPPRWYAGDDGRFHMQYELMLTNTLPLAVDVAVVEVRGDGRPIEALSRERLRAAMTLLGSETGSTTELPPSTVGTCGWT